MKIPVPRDPDTALAIFVKSIVMAAFKLQSHLQNI